MSGDSQALLSRTTNLTIPGTEVRPLIAACRAGELLKEGAGGVGGDCLACAWQPPALTTTEDVTDISLRTEHAPLFYADNREQNLPTNSGENLTKYTD